jgi:hypothetical protein
VGEQITFAVAAIGALGFGIGVVFFRDAFFFMASESEVAAAALPAARFLPFP